MIVADFRDIINDVDVIAPYIIQHINPIQLKSVNNYDFNDCVAVHIRLGDYIEKYRVPLTWYVDRIKEHYNKDKTKKFLIFSDGKDSELSEILSMPNVTRAFFGSAIADIVAISRCEYLYGSDSTFSGWGAYLGQVPCRFYRKYYGQVLKNIKLEQVDNSEILWNIT